MVNKQDYERYVNRINYKPISWTAYKKANDKLEKEMESDAKRASKRRQAALRRMNK